MSTILATYPSRSNPAKTYNVIRGDNGVEYCNCPAWRMKGGDTASRPPCKHMVDYYITLKGGNGGLKKTGVTTILPASCEENNWEKSLQRASDELRGVMGR